MEPSLATVTGVCVIYHSYITCTKVDADFQDAAFSAACHVKDTASTHHRELLRAWRPLRFTPELSAPPLPPEVPALPEASVDVPLRVPGDFEHLGPLPYRAQAVDTNADASKGEYVSFLDSYVPPKPVNEVKPNHFAGKFRMPKRNLYRKSSMVIFDAGMTVDPIALRAEAGVSASKCDAVAGLPIMLTAAYMAGSSSSDGQQSCTIYEDHILDGNGDVSGGVASSSSGDKYPNGNGSSSSSSSSNRDDNRNFNNHSEHNSTNKSNGINGGDNETDESSSSGCSSGSSSEGSNGGSSNNYSNNDVNSSGALFLCWRL